MANTGMFHYELMNLLTIEVACYFYSRHNTATFITFLDASKAFDRVNYWKLFQKLIDRNTPLYIYIYIVKITSFWYTTQTIQCSVSKFFALTIGLRQGCNLSLHLFNMYIDDLSRVLERIDNDPVKLNGTPISCLMYADDMILLSSSSCGLQKSLNTLGMYCKKWQLIVNTQKTKVMIFNKNTTKEVFKYLGNILEITKEYTYLGLSFSKSG